MLIMIANIVSTAWLNVDLIDLTRFASECPYPTKYAPWKISQLVMRLPSPRVTFLLYSNGKMVCPGARTISDRDSAMVKLVDVLHEMGYTKARVTDLRIVNVVAASKVDTKLDLNEFSESYGSKAIYVPEQFPGCSFKLSGGATANAFTSGKYYITGAKSIDQALRSLDQAGDILSMFPA